MKYRTLGKTNLEVSEIGLGTWSYGGSWGNVPEKDAIEAIHCAYDNGVNFIDTAACYGNRKSEQTVAKGIKGKRENWIIATKFAHRFVDEKTKVLDFSPSHLRNSVEGSLKALNTDYLDVLQFHLWEGNHEDTIEEIEKLTKEGKVRFWGASTRVPSGKNYLSTEKGHTIQLVYNMILRDPETEIFPVCKKNNIGVIVRVPLLSGFLTGKYDINTTFPSNDHRSKKYTKEVLKELIPKIEKFKESIPQGESFSEYALRFCLSHPTVSTLIPGGKNRKQVELNIKASEAGPLDQEYITKTKEFIGDVSCLTKMEHFK